MKNSNVQGKDQQHQKMITVQDKEEGMGNRGSTTTATIIEITDRMRPQRRETTESMQHLVKYIRDNTFGVSVGLTERVTIVITEEIRATKGTRVTKETTEETRETRAIQMQATILGGPPDCIMWMNTGT